jgi:PAS domain S-box-containing protein
MAIMSTAVLSILLVAVMLILLDRNIAKHTMLEQTKSIARIIADRSTATLVFNDPQSAAEMLGALKQEPSIVAACIYKADYKPFAVYKLQSADNCPQAKETDYHEFTPYRLLVFAPVILEGETIGFLHIEVSLDKLNNRLIQFILVTIGIVGIVVILVYPLAVQQQRFVANPILKLAEVADDVTKNGNYTVNLNYQSKDEIGVLYAAVNEMLYQINEREKARDLAEQSRRQFEELNRLLLASTAEAILGLDHNAVCTFANPACTKMLGYTNASDIVGKKVSEFMRLPDTMDSAPEPAPAKIYNACKKGEKIHVDDDFFYRNDGSAFPVEYWSHPITKGNDIVGAVVTFLNVEARKQFEQQREALIKELELKNAELESFTYTVSHDLKSPLITIRSFAGLLKDDINTGDKSAIEEDVDEIYFAAEKMQDLLDDLLELSRVGRITHEPGEVDLNQVVSEVIAVLKTKITGNNVRIEIQDKLPTVTGDFARLFEVILNLVENAIKYTSNRTIPVVKIRCDQRDSEYVVSVKDNGIGIQQPYLEKIFGLFERLDVSQEGTGIGLALVKRIVEFHGGRAWAESEGLDHGSTFYFALPKLENSNDRGSLWKNQAH